jgi:hypothetical protein
MPAAFAVTSPDLRSCIKPGLTPWRALPQAVLWLGGKQGERLMPVGMFRSEEGWVQVDYGTGNIPITRSKYEENKYKPDFDKLPSEAEYWAAEKKKEDDAKGP